MYVLFESPKPLDDFGGWGGNVGNFDQVVGYSFLGHMFVTMSISPEYAVLHPFRESYKQYGQFSDVAEFRHNILDDAGFAEYVLRPLHVERLAAILGPLAKDQVYIPLPYPHLGGDESLESYTTGKFREFMILVAASHGYA